MRAAIRAQLAATVAALLRTDEVPQQPFRVTVRCGGVTYVIECEEWPDEAPTQPTQRGLWLSPLERRIVDYLAGRGDWTRGEDVAGALQEPYQHRFKAILTNLADRAVVEVLAGSGYRVAAQGAPREAARGTA